MNVLDVLGAVAASRRHPLADSPSYIEAVAAGRARPVPGLDRDQARRLLAYLEAERSPAPPGRHRVSPARRRPAPAVRWSPPMRLVCATDGVVDGQRLDMAGLRAPTSAVPLTWQHRDRIGRVDVLEVDGRRLVATVRADLSTARGRDLAAAHGRGGRLSASVGFSYVDDGPVVRDWSVADVAWVPAGRGADPGAVTPGWYL